MAQEVLYRKWRPQTFADVSGQAPITTTLRNAVAGATPAHAYLFTGPRGTGKTSTGRILAKAVNCTAPQAGEPCEQCPSCEAFNSGRALDLIELDAASNRGIDEVRALREAAGYSPNAARYKVYLIDEVHMLTDAAFNALLKTLEEPPPHIIFILATTEVNRIPATILSRCQRFDFRRITLTAVVDRLQVIADGEGFTVPAGGLEAIARQATGSLRDAVNLLDQLVAYHGPILDIESVQQGLGLVIDHRTTELARAAVNKDLSTGLNVLAAARDDGLEIRAFAREVVNTLRYLLMLKAGNAENLPVSDAQGAELRSIAAGADTTNVVAALRALGSIDFAGDPYDSLPVEVAFASLAVGLTDAPIVVMQPRAAPTAAAPAPQRPTGPPQRRPDRPTPTPPQARPRPAGESLPDRPSTQQRPAAAAATRSDAANEAPRPAPPPFEVPDAADASPALVAMRDQWGRIRDTVRDHSKKAGALLNSPCFIKSFEGDLVEIGFRFPALVEKVQEDLQVLTAFREAVSEAAGRPVVVSAVVWDALQQAPPAAPPQRSSAVSGGSSGGGHLLEEALKHGAARVGE